MKRSKILERPPSRRTFPMVLDATPDNPAYLRCRRDRRRPTKQKIDERPIFGDTVFQEVLESAFAKNAISKFFRRQPFEILRNRQIKIWKSLQNPCRAIQIPL